jgi:Activator of Hsp90 ATPase homolog 1-like protein
MSIRKQDLVVTRVFDAPIERVWKAWSDPEDVRRSWVALFSRTLEVSVNGSGWTLGRGSLAIILTTSAAAPDSPIDRLSGRKVHVPLGSPFKGDTQYRSGSAHRC